MVEERPFRAVFGCRIKLGFSPGAEFNRDTSTQLLLYQSKQPAAFDSHRSTSNLWKFCVIPAVGANRRSFFSYLQRFCLSRTATHKLFIFNSLQKFINLHRL